MGALGPSVDNDPLIIVELRTRAHDALHARHDRDRRSLIFYAPTLLKKHNVCVVRISPSCRFTTHAIQPTQPSEQWICFLAYQEHTRLAIAPGQDALSALVGCPQSLVRPVGWKALIELGAFEVTISKKISGKCPHCQRGGARLHFFGYRWIDCGKGRPPRRCKTARVWIWRKVG